MARSRRCWPNGTPGLITKNKVLFRSAVRPPRRRSVRLPECDVHGHNRRRANRPPRCPTTRPKVIDDQATTRRNRREHASSRHRQIVARAVARAARPRTPVFLPGRELSISVSRAHFPVSSHTLVAMNQPTAASRCLAPARCPGVFSGRQFDRIRTFRHQQDHLDPDDVHRRQRAFADRDRASLPVCPFRPHIG